MYLMGKFRCKGPSFSADQAANMSVYRPFCLAFRTSIRRIAWPKGYRDLISQCSRSFWQSVRKSMWLEAPLLDRRQIAVGDTLEKMAEVLKGDSSDFC